MYPKIIACRAEGLANEIKELQGQLADYNTVKIRNKNKYFHEFPILPAFDLLSFESFIFFHCHSVMSFLFVGLIFMLTVLKISLLLLLSLITAFGQNKYGYWNGWYYSRLQCSKCFSSYQTVTRESWEKIVYFNCQTKLLFTCINCFLFHLFLYS